MATTTSEQLRFTSIDGLSVVHIIGPAQACRLGADINN